MPSHSLGPEFDRAGTGPATEGAFVAFTFKNAARIGAPGILVLLVSTSAHAQAPIRACANPAGQLRLIGAAEQCRSQETLVTWNSAGAQGATGPQGPQGIQGLPGSDAPGVTGGADRGPAPGTGPALLGAAQTALTTDNIATGFPGYMVWANVSLQYSSGNVAQGTGPSPSGAGCAIVYTVDGRAGTFLADARGITFPIFAFNQNDRVAQFAVGLTGMIGQDLSPPLAPTDVVNVTLQCNTPGFNPPPTGPQPIPVKATSWSLTGIGVNKAFQ